MAVRSQYSRLPKHIGLIPDGNRRWAKKRGLPAGAGYAAGLLRGLKMLQECKDLGISEVSVYGFTQDNTKRPSEQKNAFIDACVQFVSRSEGKGIALRVLGDATSPLFPKELVPYTTERIGEGPLKVNLLVNYGWQWDIETAVKASQSTENQKRPFQDLLASNDVSRIDLIVRWGGMRRLSGFLPIQSVYSDFFVVDAYWPDYEPEQFHEALDWYQVQDVTLGG